LQGLTVGERSTGKGHPDSLPRGGGILPFRLVGSGFLIDAGLRFGTRLRAFGLASRNKLGAVLLDFGVAHFADGF
jgi:hypothetical protein